MNSNNGPKVSIVVAVYNSEPFLEKLLDSIVKQTYANIEILLIDDGSPDGSGAICDRYASKDARIKVVHKKNGGTCDARNVGIEQSTGQYLMIVDGDDWLAIDCVEYLLGLALSANSDMALSDHIFTTRDQIQIEHDNISVWSAEQAVVSLIYPRMAVGPWSKIYKMEMINRHHLRFDIPWSGEGLYFSSMAAAFSNHVVVGHRKVYNYRMNNVSSGLTNYNVMIAKNALYNIKNIGRVMPIRTPRVRRAIRWHIWKNYNFLLRLILATNGRRKFWKEYLICLVMIRMRAFSAVFRTEFCCREKMSFLKRAVFPERYARALTAQQIKDLRKDVLK